MKDSKTSLELNDIFYFIDKNLIEITLESYEWLFKNLTKDLKYQILNLIDNNPTHHYASPFYVFNEIDYSFKKFKEEFFSECLSRNFLWREIRFFLCKPQSDDSGRIEEVRLLPDPTHTAFSSFPPYQEFAESAQMIERLVFIPLEMDFIFEYIREASRNQILSEYQEIVNRRENFEELYKYATDVLQQHYY